jgi:hypothetical protein
MLVHQIIVFCWCLLSVHVFRGAREPLDINSPINIPETGTFVSVMEPKENAPWRYWRGVTGDRSDHFGINDPLLRMR